MDPDPQTILKIAPHLFGKLTGGEHSIELLDVESQLPGVLFELIRAERPLVLKQDCRVLPVLALLARRLGGLGGLGGFEGELLQAELGRSTGALFASFDLDPIAAASIGQVSDLRRL